MQFLTKTKFLNKKAWLCLGLFLLSAPVIVTPAYAQSDVHDRLERLENELNTLNRAVYRGGATAGSGGAGLTPQAQAATEVRIQQMETELRDLRGTLEKQNHDIKQMERKLDRALNDMQMRVQDLEGDAKTSSAAPAIKPPAAAGAPVTSSYENGTVQTFSWGTGAASAPTPLASGDQPQPSNVGAASAYEAAFSYLKGNQYDRAAEGFDVFIEKYPNHPLVPNAKYWLGETYYVRGQYADASRIFAEGYKQYPSGTKAPDNLLKLGMSLAGMGSQKDACVAFKQLQKDYKVGATSVLRRAEQEMKRIGCGA